MEVTHRYVKQRRQFGRHPHFTDQGAELLLDLRPNEEHAKSWIVKQQATMAVQAAPDMSEHEVNTTAVVLVNQGMAHLEGGWPKEVDHTEVEQVIRFRRKVEKDEDYIKQVVRLGAVVEDLIKQNNAIDIYEEYFEDVPPYRLAEPPSTRTITVLRDPATIKRGAQSLSWQPDNSGRLAVAYSIVEFQGQPPGMSPTSYVWNAFNPSAPETTLGGPVPLVNLQFNQKDQNLIGAGQYNGQITFFDLRKGASPLDASPIEKSHRSMVHDFAWVQSKSGTELMSTSIDGSVLWWDLRKLGEPLEALLLKERGSEAVLGGSALEYSPAAGPTKFMVGTQQGAILAGNRKAKQPSERITASYAGHHNFVYSVSRNPFFPKFFMSVGDWRACIWQEDLKSAILSTPYAPTYLQGGWWSPHRPGVFYTISHAGVLDCWDYYFKQKEPVLSLRVADKPLTNLALQAGSGQRLAGVGCTDGSVTLLQLSQGLVEVQSNEKTVIGSMLEREASREKNLEKTAKEAKARAKKEAARQEQKVEPWTDEDFKAIEKEYLDKIAEFEANEAAILAGTFEY